MSIRTSPWPAGVPCWTDLATPDVQAVQPFYSAVLGWQFGEPHRDYSGYVMAEVRGAAAAGLGPMMGDQQRSSWTLYLASDDADATAADITQSGGTVLVAPDDVGPMGRLLIASDPTGGVFGVWQAGSMIGASLVNEPGGLFWEDLRSTDPELARAFYNAVFRYDFHPLPEAGPDYFTFHSAEEPAPLGGMGGMFGAPAGTPSHWLVYFCVADCDAAVDAAQREGGHVLAPADSTPYGRMAALVDPAGAAFWVMQAPPEAAVPEGAR
ncbi:MAG TPA: VOC family protein [Propionibacteriaceae bacterium]|nr:VOC family protein [Propionibacteriaceae bacterium]